MICIVTHRIKMSFLLIETQHLLLCWCQFSLSFTLNQQKTFNMDPVLQHMSNSNMMFKLNENVYSTQHVYYEVK